MKRFGILLLTIFCLINCGKDQGVKEEPVVVKPKTSGILLANMDTSVNPTEDFYRYVNGGWLKTNEIPEDKTAYGVINELFDANQEQLKAIVDDISKMENLDPGSDHQKIRDLYLSFMDLERREELGIQPIVDDLEFIAGIGSKDDMLRAFVSLGKKGIQSPVGFFVHQDGKIATEYIGYFTQSGLGMPDRDYYLNDQERFQTIRQKYTELIEKQWANAGLKGGADSSQAILAFETEIAKSHWTRVQNRDREKTYNKMSADEIAQLAPKLNWGLIFTEMGLQDQASFIVRQPDFLTAIAELLAKTSLEDLKTYAIWKVLDHNAGNLTAAMDEANFEFYTKTLRGAEVQRPLWKRGISAVDTVVGESLGKEYVARHFPPEAKKRMDQLVQNLIQAYDEALAELEWMGPETREAARAKLKKVTPKIGYPNVWKDYSTLEIVADNLQQNMEQAAIWEHNDMMAKLGKPIDREEWHMTPQTINAYYSPTMNEIVFPAGILQPPIFNLEADDAVNYGAIGMIIGHELGHAFDDQGSRSDGDGNLNNWWTEQDRTEFEKRTQILVEQYNEYSPVEGMNVNGELTLGENIGDLGGTTIAYRAYQISLKGQPSVEMDGFTGEQRFFIGSAAISCQKRRDEAMRQLIMTDPHSPKEYRVNGVVANMPEFYEAFDVKEGDKLFRPQEKRVKIW